MPTISDGDERHRAHDPGDALDGSAASCAGRLGLGDAGLAAFLLTLALVGTHGGGNLATRRLRVGSPSGPTPSRRGVSRWRSWCRVDG